MDSYVGEVSTPTWLPDQWEVYSRLYEDVFVKGLTFESPEEYEAWSQTMPLNTQFYARRRQNIIDNAGKSYQIQVLYNGYVSERNPPIDNIEMMDGRPCEHWLGDEHINRYLKTMIQGVQGWGFVTSLAFRRDLNNGKEQDFLPPSSRLSPNPIRHTDILIPYSHNAAGVENPFLVTRKRKKQKPNNFVDLTNSTVDFGTHQTKGTQNVIDIADSSDDTLEDILNSNKINGKVKSQGIHWSLFHVDIRNATVYHYNSSQAGFPTLNRDWLKFYLRNRYGIVVHKVAVVDEKIIEQQGDGFSCGMRVGHYASHLVRGTPLKPMPSLQSIRLRMNLIKTIIGRDVGDEKKDG